MLWWVVSTAQWECGWVGTCRQECMQPCHISVSTLSMSYISVQLECQCHISVSTLSIFSQSHTHTLKLKISKFTKFIDFRAGTTFTRPGTFGFCMELVLGPRTPFQPGKWVKSGSSRGFRGSPHTQLAESMFWRITKQPTAPNESSISRHYALGWQKNVWFWILGINGLS